jgi:hypothetical protein
MNKLQALQILGLTGTVSKSDIKIAYQRKAKEFHPDRNPAGLEIMKMINVAYELVKDEIEITVHADKEMESYPQSLAMALNAIIHLDLTIEICGLWIWVSGDTKAHKDQLKSAGYFWSAKKTMWYFRPTQAKSFNRYRGKREWSIDKIRASYGAITPRKKSQLRLDK